jgi:hypothetical protein
VDRPERHALALDDHAVGQGLHRHRQAGVVDDQLAHGQSRVEAPEIGHAAHVVPVAVREEDPRHVAEPLAPEKAHQERGVGGDAGAGVEEDRLALADEVGVGARPGHQPGVEAEHAADAVGQAGGPGEVGRPELSA